MADSEAFRYAAEALTSSTSLEAIEARGTVRIALKQAGHDSASIQPSEMAIIFEKVMPDELVRRGVENAAELCSRLIPALHAMVDATAKSDRPEDVFRRLGGDSSC